MLLLNEPSIDRFGGQELVMHTIYLYGAKNFRLHFGMDSVRADGIIRIWLQACAIRTPVMIQYHGEIVYGAGIPLLLLPYARLLAQLVRTSGTVIPWTRG